MSEEHLNETPPIEERDRGESMNIEPDGTGSDTADLPAGPQEEQLLYAKILEIGMLVGLGLLLVTFALYLTRIVPPTVPFDQLPDYWTLNVNDFLQAVDEQFLAQGHHLTGWAWLSQVGRGDYLNFVPIAILSAVTIVCYLGIVPVLARKKDWAFVFMAILEAAILILAASGILAVGH